MGRKMRRERERERYGSGEGMGEGGGVMANGRKRIGRGMVENGERGGGGQGEGEGDGRRSWSKCDGTSLGEQKWRDVGRRKLEVCV